MKNILVLLLFLHFNSLTNFGQSCNCHDVVISIEKELETNSASFQHQIVINEQFEYYKAHVKLINKLSKKITSKKDCIGLVARLIAIIRDNHLFIDYLESEIPYESITDTALIRDHYSKEPIILKPIKYVPKHNELEGIWFFQDGSFSVDIFQHKTKLHDFVGTISQSDGLFWLEGQVKLEFFYDSKNELQCLYWRNTRRPQQFAVRINGTTLEIGRLFKFYRDTLNTTENTNSISDSFEFKELSSKTTYLRIPSFMLDYENTIDSLVHSSIGSIQSHPFLIIDIRNNGGGGNASITPLLPLILTKKEYTDPISASMWVSLDNYNWYDSTKYDYADTYEDSLYELAYVDTLKQYKGTFTPFEFEKGILDTIYNYPKKVAIICNRWSASMTESFILYSREGNKTKVYGENTGGLLSYGDWRPYEVKDLGIWVSITTLHIINKYDLDFEKIGITPDINLQDQPENSWILYVQNDLEKN
ncbi:MAG: hypothetical protein H6600_06820 [Flavobacteriales bacterium]|nr:hypothetical protein [Flavobacteriales bacterium]MCB9198152.1 hypothetical protein [Flavobacteriales bacterium]